ncbi:MAG: phosphoglycerate mutase family protein [archaeon]
MNILLIRHGVSEYVEGDYHLSELGNSQSKRLAKKLKSINITKTYSSDSIRVFQTYNYYKKEIKHIPHKTTKKLREISNVVDRHNKRSLVEFYLSKDRLRADEMFDELLSNKDDAVLAVFCHGNIIKYFLSKVMNTKKNFNIWETIIINNVSISIIEVNKQRFRIKSINNINHLEKKFIKEFYEKNTKSLLYDD